MSSRPSEGDDPVSAGFWRKNWCACVAFLLAFVALALIILPPTIDQPPRSSFRAARSLLHTLSADADGVRAAHDARMQSFKIGGVSVAIAAAALALVSVVRRERRSLSLAALGVAAVAILWHYVVVGIVIAVILAIVLSILN